MSDSGWKSFLAKDLCLKIAPGATPRGGKETYLPEGSYSEDPRRSERSDTLISLNFAMNSSNMPNDKTINHKPSAMSHEP